MGRTGRLRSASAGCSDYMAGHPNKKGAGGLVSQKTDALASSVGSIIRLIFSPLSVRGCGYTQWI